MVRFAEDLYTSDSVMSRLSTIKWKMACGIGMINTFFITMSLSSEDLFDIYSASMFKQRSFRKSDLIIIGIASDMDEAKNLIVQMIDECIDATGSALNARKYFENKYIN